MLAFLAVAVCSVQHHGAADAAPTAGSVMNLLRSAAAKKPVSSSSERVALAAGQHPVAIVLTCSDSRVSPEALLRQGPSKLFVIRVAGNIANADALGSIEYAYLHFHSPVILVMGHSECGAVKAALMPPNERAKLPENIRHLVDQVETAGLTSVRSAVVANVRHQMRIVANDPILTGALASHSLVVRGAVFDIASGKIEFIGP